MDEERVHYYYSELKRYVLKSDSTWTDNAKSLRPIAHDFYNEISGTTGTFNEALKSFYRGYNNRVVSGLAHDVKNLLNRIIHENWEIDEECFFNIYKSLVNLIYLATNIMPDEETLELCGITHNSNLKNLNEQQKDIVLCNSQILYVNAGPGTGKTFLLVNKLINYINDSQSKEKIIAISFTNTAANELGERFRSKCL